MQHSGFCTLDAMPGVLNLGGTRDQTPSRSPRMRQDVTLQLCPHVFPTASSNDYFRELPHLLYWFRLEDIALCKASDDTHGTLGSAPSSIQILL